MPEFFDPVRYLGNQQNHQRMYEFERDILRVKNPLNEDFTFIYDQMPIIVLANSTKDMERYLVRSYINNMIGHIYNIFAEEKMAKMEEAFRRTHPDVMDDPYLINQQIYLKMKRSDDPEFQKKVISDCILGVVKKYGSDRQVPKTNNLGRIDPNTPLYQSLIDGFKNIEQEMPAPISQKSEWIAPDPSERLG